MDAQEALETVCLNHPFGESNHVLAAAVVQGGDYFPVQNILHHILYLRAAHHAARDSGREHGFVGGGREKFYLTYHGHLLRLPRPKSSKSAETSSSTT